MKKLLKQFLPTYAEAPAINNIIFALILGFLFVALVAGVITYQPSDSSITETVKSSWIKAKANFK